MKRSVTEAAIIAVVMLLTFMAVYAAGKTDKPVERTQVIVVGAGMAGLMSSLSLAEKGAKVILLENQLIFYSIRPIFNTTL